MRIGKRLYSLMMFIVVALLGGLLTAGLILPVAGMATAAGTTMIEGLDSLPTELKAPPQAERSRLLNADGKVLAYFYDENRVYKPLADIAPIMRTAQVAIEDHRFYEHGALDLTGTLRALVRSSQGNTQGGSSLTQQYVRLVLVEIANSKNDTAARAAATENTIARKIRELRYAIAMEKELSKDTILERYLNIAYYGEGAYGVEAAAKHYFNTTAAKLNLAEAAMLAGLVRNPVATSPVKHPAQAIERRNNVLDRMAELTDASGVSLVTAAEVAEAKATVFDKKKVRVSKLGCANSEFPFICDYAYRTLLKTPSLGSTPEERRDLVFRSGLTIQTQIDPKAQRKAEKTIQNYLSAKDPVVSVITMIEPGTGLIRAMAQNRNEMGEKKGQTYYNYAVNQAMGGADGYQGGSTFKAFVAAAALEEGLGSYSTINAKAHMNFKGHVFKSCNGGVKVNKDWNVDNASPSGRMNMWSGTKHSVNTYYVQLEEQVGLCAVTKMAKRLGLEMSSGQDIVKEYNQIPSFTLGSVEVTPLSMVEAYGTFAARGMHCEPIILKSIKTKTGESKPVPDANCKQVIRKEVADAIAKIFQGPYNGGTATSAKVPGVAMAGKTGTVPKNKAVWTVGFTPDLVGAAVISYDNSKKFSKFWKNKPSFLRYVTLPDSKRWLSGFSGNNAGANLLKPAFAAALADIDKRHNFVEPPSDVLQGERVDLPGCDGISASSCASVLRRAGFTSYTVRVDSELPVGTLVGTSPSGSAPKFSQIAMLISKGPKIEPTIEPTPTPTPTKPAKPAKPGRR